MRLILCARPPLTRDSSDLYQIRQCSVDGARKDRAALPSEKVGESAHAGSFGFNRATLVGGGEETLKKSSGESRSDADPLFSTTVGLEARLSSSGLCSIARMSGGMMGWVFGIYPRIFRFSRINSSISRITRLPISCVIFCQLAPWAASLR